ncbi:hypothetical protein TRP8649_03893 [Pelagimonas phthalicica]|uniref:Hemolysin-type calcium-binding repeat-containing protein n=1 Tax=Pelagimonas phthalicica TaxID=1037362 RepID=A0A238JHS0_9RHOB|nr:hypothetical protein [Pelagimonas phthalicica]TDS89071.1 hypothetical protein CLV87_4260 [Pelagimonas phthalicica]SMX29754.1 hypothetical protein TRP8649_03893 [Pelagimonas phthalicica]
MGLGVLLALFSLALLGTAFIDSGSSGGSEDDEPSNPDLEIDDEGNLYGTQGDDVITFDDIDDGIVPTTISTGDGDDLVDLRVPENWVEDNPDMSLNDTGIPDVVDMGDGDDTFAATYGWLEFGHHVLGGDGDDSILAPGAFEAEVHGGDGNDTIDVSESASTVVTGGAGDDHILTFVGYPGGTGFFTSTSGGEGNDTLDVTVDHEFWFPIQGEDWTTDGVLGNGGVDHFIVELNEGLELSDETVSDPDALSLFQEDFSFLENSDGTAVRTTALTLTDFDPQTETLQLNLTPESDQFEVGSVRIEGDGIVVTYIPLEYQEYLLPREIMIRLDTDGLTWDQITLAGADNAVLSPVAA